MKPCKKQTISKKDTDTNISAPKIKAFFKSAPKNFVIDDKSTETFFTARDESRKFYIQALKKKLQEKDGVNVQSAHEEEEIEDISYQESGAHVNFTEKKDPNDINGNQDSASSNACLGCVQLTIECNEWKAKAIELEEKYKANNKKYARLAIHDSELGVKYKDLLKMATSHNRPDNDEAVSFSEDIFTPNQIRFFRSMPLDKNKDSSFILQCLDYAYKTDQSVLCYKTLKGKPEWREITVGGEEIFHPAKDPLTPKKADRIKELFIERVAKCNIDPAIYGERMKESYLNRLFANGIKNIAKKQKISST